MYNKLFYGVRGGIELLDRKWKGLSEHVTLECDGKDLTQRIKELKVHTILFLNIPSYSGGTRPWNKSAGNNATDDGLIEVIGLTIMQIVSATRNIVVPRVITTGNGRGRIACCCCCSRYVRASPRTSAITSCVPLTMVHDARDAIIFFI